MWADLQAEAEAAGCRLLQQSADFRRPDGLDSLMARILEPLKTEPPEAITLINNAGMLEPVMPLQEAEASLLTDHLHVNLLAPVLLTSAFLRETRAWPAEKTVVNISSGAGKKPYAGWSAYCTAKAGLDMLTRCISTEQQDQTFPARAVSIAPGVVDTGMQELIRSTPPDRFPQVDRFVRLKEQGSCSARPRRPTGL
ncbi:SDR family NAD(P)-dependent oxidoreductase [Paenibacillus sp. P26]|nr:SDR family NAD(P)-dependent oxidoreductase [Paenibacillus sp. P26]